MQHIIKSTRRMLFCSGGQLWFLFWQVWYSLSWQGCSSRTCLLKEQKHALAEMFLSTGMLPVLSSGFQRIWYHCALQSSCIIASWHNVIHCDVQYLHHTSTAPLLIPPPHPNPITNTVIGVPPPFAGFFLSLRDNLHHRHWKTNKTKQSPFASKRSPWSLQRWY